MKENINIKNILKKIAISLIIIIILVAGINIYIKVQTDKNTKKFKQYINSNYSTNSKDETYYTVYSQENILTKTIRLDKVLNSNITISINKNREIKGELKLYGKNQYGKDGISYLKSTLKNKKFSCNFVSNDGYKARCDLLKKNSEIFEKEIKKIIKNSDTKLKYINPK